MVTSKLIGERVGDGLVEVDNHAGDISDNHREKRSSMVERAENERGAGAEKATKELKKKRKQGEDRDKYSPVAKKKRKVTLVEPEDEVISRPNQDTEIGDGTQKQNNPDLDHQVPKKKKKDRKKSDLTISEGGRNDKSDSTSRPRKESITKEKSADAAKPKKASKKKEKHLIAEVAAKEPDINPPTVDETRTRKQKHLRTEDVQTGVSGHDEVSKPEKKKKKRVSRKYSEFPDPSEDTTLSDSSKKALVYVHAQVTAQPEWKFNKARQNWIIRNLWDDTAVPDRYFPSCLKYLAGVKGNIRQHLAKSCKELIESSSRPNTETMTDGQSQERVVLSGVASGDSTEEQERKRSLKVARAQSLSAILEADAEENH